MQFIQTIQGVVRTSLIFIPVFQVRCITKLLTFSQMKGGAYLHMPAFSACFFLSDFPLSSFPKLTHPYSTSQVWLCRKKGEECDGSLLSATLWETSRGQLRVQGTQNLDPENLPLDLAFTAHTVLKDTCTNFSEPCFLICKSELIMSTKKWHPAGI